MAEVTAQHGFDAAALRESELHPEYKIAWEKRRDALKQIREFVNRHDAEINSLAQEVQALRARPFS